MKSVEKQAATSVGATLLALVASQHHNLHMALLALGMGGSGMTFIRVYPGVRRAMLAISIVLMAAGVRSIFRRPASLPMRVMTIAFSAVTLLLVAWSLIRFGL